jgi:ABC-type antimicrobial peptide transport system permease subunit
MVAFATLAFVLSAIGLYGVINYLVELRTREIGIRLAIGATRSRICREILRGGIMHAVIGVLAGVGAAE